MERRSPGEFNPWVNQLKRLDAPGGKNVEATNVRFDSTATAAELKDRIRKIVKQHAGLKSGREGVEDSTNLYHAGMTSQASVVLMIAIESDFELEFPDSMLSREVFSSVESIANAIRECSERAEL